MRMNYDDKIFDAIDEAREIYSYTKWLLDDEYNIDYICNFIKRCIHKNWRLGVAVATIVFEGRNDERGFASPTVEWIIERYPIVEDKIRKGKALKQVVYIDGCWYDLVYTVFRGYVYRQKKPNCL